MYDISVFSFLIFGIVQYFAPLAFPQILDLGLRINQLGHSSVTYEIGVFEEGKASPAAVGGYTHVFVERQSRKSTAIDKCTRDGLRKLLLDGNLADAKL